MAVRPRSIRELLEFAEDNAVDGVGFIPGPEGVPGGSTPIPFRQRGFTYGDNAPLITTDLPDVNDSPSQTLDFIDGVTDSFIRGGATLAGIRAVKDTERITKFLLTPEGIAHSATQVALQRSNPQTIISATNRQWSPANLLAQIPANIVPKLNIRRDGFALKEKNRKTYEDEMESLKKDQTVPGEYSVAPEGLAIGNVDIDIPNYNPYTLTDLYENFRVISDTEYGVFDSTLSIIKTYSGGAGSIFGVGSTDINRTTNTNTLLGTVIEKKQLPTTLTEPGTRADIIKRNESIRKKYKLGDPGQFNPDLFVYNEDGTISDDEVNVLNGYSKRFSIDQLNASPIITRYNLDETALDEYQDFIKFRFALIDTSDPLRDEVILFRAFLDDYNDNLQGKWTPYQYNGRAEDFHTYSGFGREINFNFKVGAQSEEELLPLYFKLNALMGSTSPEYVNRRMRGRYIRITLGDILSDTPGFFNNINITWNPSYVWEISPDKQLPQVISVNCNFTPIHDFAPQSRKDSPFILTRAALKKARQEAATAVNIDRMRNG